MAGFSVWQNSLTGTNYRVADDCCRKIAVSGVVLAFDLYFSGGVTNQANTSDLRAWLNSIPSA